MKPRFSCWIALAAALALPVIAHGEPTAPYVNVKNSQGFFHDSTGQNFTDAMPLYEAAFLRLGFQEFTPINQSGFDSLTSQVNGDLFFDGAYLSLADYVLPTADSAGHAIYRPLPDASGFSAFFFRWDNSTHVLLAGETLWYRIDVDNTADTQPVISALFRFTTLNTGSSDPLADAFYQQLMLLTNGTGYLHLQGSPISDSIIFTGGNPPSGFNDGDYASAFSGILTPVPEPATLAALLAAAAIACTAFVRRRK